LKKYKLLLWLINFFISFSKKNYSNGFKDKDKDFNLRNFKIGLLNKSINNFKIL
jgi:hypothetical protein